MFEELLKVSDYQDPIIVYYHRSLTPAVQPAYRMIMHFEEIHDGEFFDMDGTS